MSKYGSLIFVADDKVRDLTVAIGNEFESCESLNAENYVPCSRSGQSLGTTWLMMCDEPVRGRYLVVYQNTTGSLTLCDVEVYGLPVPGEYMMVYLKVTGYTM